MSEPIIRAGLVNRSDCCSMNAILIQMFMNTKFRRLIMSVDPQSGGSHLFKTLVQQLKEVFLKLSQTAHQRSVTAEEFLRTFRSFTGNETNGTDASIFYKSLLHTLQTHLDSNSKSKLASLYEIVSMAQIKFDACRHYTPTVISRDYTYVCKVSQSLTNLEDCLMATTRGVIEERDCTKCMLRSSAARRSAIIKVSENLVFELDRWDEEGESLVPLASPFTFPLTLNMYSYTHEGRENTAMQEKTNNRLSTPSRATDSSGYYTTMASDLSHFIYELVGAVVHDSRDVGHYYSFVRSSYSRKCRTWMKVDDERVSEMCEDELLEKLTRNLEISENVYMLFYRKQNLPNIEMEQ